TNRQAIFGGFLSAEVVGADNAVLWSYLVTPSKFAWGSVSDDLSESLVKEMVGAQAKIGRTPNQRVVAQSSLHGAGSRLRRLSINCGLSLFSSNIPTLVSATMQSGQRRAFNSYCRIRW